MSFTERAGLLSALLLAGCASPTIVPGTPSGNVVDGLLTRSSADIMAMQYRVYQTGPTAIRPQSASSLSSALPVPSSLVGTSSPKSSIFPKASPQKQPAPVQSDGFVRVSGAAPTLRAALRKIVPSENKVVFNSGANPDTPELWQWTGNDRWPFVVDKMLAAHGLKATINEKNKTITIEPVQHAQSAGKVISPAVPPASPQLKGVAVSATPVRLPVRGRNPFHGDQTAEKTTIASKPGAPIELVKAPVVPVKAPVPVRHWQIEPGVTLKDWIFSKAASEPCSVPGIKYWTVAWATPVNYRIDAPLSFDGSFREMLNGLFMLYGTAKVPLYAGTRSEQCVVSVDDKEVH